MGCTIFEETNAVKGILLSGGLGTRLFPLTTVIGKQLLPIFDKPMIFYSLSTLIHAGVDDVLIITTSDDLEKYRLLFNSGRHLGINIEYAIQNSPEGIPQAILIAESFLNGESFWLMLGDNMAHGPQFGRYLKNSLTNSMGAKAFAYHVQTPELFGVVTFDKKTDKILSLEEKPLAPDSNWALIGLYHFDPTAISKTLSLKPSPRGELEIIDLLKLYFEERNLEITKISRGNAWFDLGTPKSILKAAVYVESVQSIQGQLVGSPEEASLNAGLITKDQAEKSLERYTHTEYFKTLKYCLLQ